MAPKFTYGKSNNAAETGLPGATNAKQTTVFRAKTGIVIKNAYSVKKGVAGMSH
ncbi:MAG: hypothetical protein WBB25_20950 [Sulfitobacter sp.]